MVGFAGNVESIVLDRLVQNNQKNYPDISDLSIRVDRLMLFSLAGVARLVNYRFFDLK